MSSESLLQSFHLITLANMLTWWSRVKITRHDSTIIYLQGQVLYPTAIASYINQYVQDNYPDEHHEFHVCPELLAGACASYWNSLLPWGISKDLKARTRKSSIGRICQMGYQKAMSEREIIFPSPDVNNKFPMPEGFTDVPSSIGKLKSYKITLYRTRSKEIRGWLHETLQIDAPELAASKEWGDLIQPIEYFDWLRKCSDLESKLLHLQSLFCSDQFAEQKKLASVDMDEPVVNNLPVMSLEMDISPLPAQEVTFAILDSVSNHLRKELKSMETAKKGKYMSYQGIATSNNGANNASDLLSDCRKEDALNGPDFFRILLPLLMSQVELNRVCTLKNNSVWERLLKMESISAFEYVGESKEDPDNIKIAAKMDIVQSCADMVCHILLNCRSKGHTPSEWIFTISTLLKTGRVDGAVIDILNHLHLTVANSTVTRLIDDGLSEYYSERFKNLAADIKKNDGIHIVMFDNYAKLKWAQEYVSKDSNFTRITDSTTIMSLKRDRIAGLLTYPDRPRACSLVNDSEIDAVLETLLSDKCETDLRNLLFFKHADGSINLEDPILDKRFTSLLDFQNIASLPCKSGSHEEMLQFMKLLLLDLFEGTDRDIICPNDPQFSLEVLRYAVSVPDSMKGSETTILIIAVSVY